MHPTIESPCGKRAWPGDPLAIPQCSRIAQSTDEIPPESPSVCAAATEVGGKLRGIVEIEGRILRELDKMFGGGGERAAKNRFMDKIDAEAEGMAAGGAKNIVAELIFLLIAFGRKRGDDGSELIIAKSFESGSGVKIRAEGKR